MKEKGAVFMKKFLSVLLSLILCASVVVTNPPIEVDDNFSDPLQNEQPEDNGNVASPCDDSGEPSAGGDTH